ncbi:MAG: DUF6690 family protein [Pirellulales bacterium]
MFGRSSLLLLALAASLGVPYLVSSSGVRNLIKSGTTSEETPDDIVAGGPRIERRTAVEAAEARTSSPRSFTAAESEITPLNLRPEGMPVNNFAEVFRFDVTTAWVLARWPRVSTRLSTLPTHGYRVALVTGTLPHDLAGSLTYYFNDEQKVQRITFLGTTGDTRPLVNLVTSRYGLVRQQDEGPGVHLYQFLAGKKVASELRIRSARTVSLAEPHSRFEVALVLERPAKMK